jgi:hypothetical protein
MWFDLQNPAKAQVSFVIALQAAQDAQDALLGSAVLAHMAFIPAFSGAPMRHATRYGHPAYSQGEHPHPPKCWHGSMPSKRK